jgi:hypothetical protein
MSRRLILELDLDSPIQKLDSFEIIIIKYIFNDSYGCKLTDSELKIVLNLKWPNLRALYTCKFILN